MRLTFFITTLGGGGAERVLSDLSNHLCEKNHIINILVLRGNEAKYSLDGKINIKYLQPNYYQKETSIVTRLREIWVVRKTLKNMNSTDALICFLELPVLLSLLFRRCYSQPLLICERNNPENYPQIYQELYKKYAQRADGCVCQTDYIAHWYRNIIREDAIEAVIPNAIGAAISKVPYCQRPKNAIVTMGRLEPQKNHRLLIESFALITEKNNEYKLIIYGEGSLRDELVELTRQLNIEEKVSFPGYCSDTAEILSTAKIFVLSSDFEGMPNALAEAMSMGISCVATDCGGGGAKQLIDDGVNGILVPCGDKVALAQALETLIIDEDFAYQIGLAAREIRNTLSAHAIYNVWENLLYDLVQQDEEVSKDG